MNILIFTALLLFIFNPISGLSTSRADFNLKTFTCDSVYTVEHNVYNSKVSYDNNNKIIQYVYTKPISLTEYYDYNKHNKYTFETINTELSCDAEIINEDFPAFYTLDTDIFVKTEKIDGIDVSFYYRENSNIKNFTIKNSHINTITYQDGSYQTFKNCVSSVMPSKDTSKCNKPFCPTISDIVFVVDESSFLTEDEFNKVKALMVNLVNNYDISTETTNIGVVSYAESARIISKMSTNKENLINAINNMGKYGGGSCVSCGLNKALELFAYQSDERKAMNLDKIVISFVTKEITLPVINNEHKVHEKCYAFGNCKRSCYSSINTVECSSKCPNTRDNYCYNNTCYKYDNTDKTWYLDVINDKCIINNQEFNNNCCVNGPDACCCEMIEIINGCDFGDYDASALENSANYLKNNNIISITVGVRFDNKTELESFSNKVYLIDNFDELDSLNENITRNSCKTIKMSSCGLYCNGLCGVDKTCYCPECENSGDYCEIYECKNVLGKVDGCQPKSIECSVGDDKCRSVSRNSAVEGCCVYVNNSCDDHNECTLDFCYPDGGCYHENVVCDDYDPCTINKCYTDRGCVYEYNNILCGNNKVCKKLTTKTYKCFPTTCSTDSDCNLDNTCNEARCENNVCVNHPFCIPDNPCLLLDYCDENTQLSDPSKCTYKEITCKPPNSCYTNGRCVPLNSTNYECVFDEVQCDKPEGLCSYSYCHPEKGCQTAEIKCDDSDPCMHSLGCIEHPEWGNYTCEYVPKCEQKVCKDTYCTDTGECIYTDRKCDVINPCFTYDCENDECIPKLPEKEAVDPCGECLEEYHKLGQYLDLTNSSCKGKIVNNSNVPFNVISSSSSSETSFVSEAGIKSVSYLFIFILIFIIF